MIENKKGTVDLLHGPILKSLMLFMIPIMISSAFQQLYNAVDTAIVGNYLGEDSLAAIGSCSSVFELFVGFAMSLANGFGIVAARCYGSGDERKLRRAVAGSMEIGFLTTAVLTIAAVFLLRPLLHLIQTPAEIFEESYAYINVIAMFVIIMFAYNLFSGLLRSIGNSVMPLVFLIISSVLNIFLDILLITSFSMGVVGAAVATIISQGVSVVLCLIYIVWKTPYLIPHGEDFRVGKELMTDLAGQGYSMAVMGSIVSCGSIILQSGINSLGKEIIAGHVAARKIYAVCNLPFISMGTAISTFIGQNMGADNPDRILRSLRTGIVYSISAAVIVSAFLFVAARPLVALISGSDNPVILSNGSMMLYVVGPFYAVLGILMQSRFALQAMGEKILPLISSGIEFVGKILFTAFFIPMFGYTAVIFCEPLIWCVMTVQLLFALHGNAYIKEAKKRCAAH